MAHFIILILLFLQFTLAYIPTDFKDYYEPFTFEPPEDYGKLINITYDHKSANLTILSPRHIRATIFSPTLFLFVFENQTIPIYITKDIFWDVRYNKNISLLTINFYNPSTIQRNETLSIHGHTPIYTTNIFLNGSSSKTLRLDLLADGPLEIVFNDERKTLPLPGKASEIPPYNSITLSLLLFTLFANLLVFLHTHQKRFLAFL